jgi:hypothetical protein
MVLLQNKMKSLIDGVSFSDKHAVKIVEIVSENSVFTCESTSS